jgi:hypothetical protein
MAEAFDAQAYVLNQEDQLVEQMRKQCESQLHQPNLVLETATCELKSLSSRDVSIIKTSNSRPSGVLWVVKAMCIIMNINVDYDSFWPVGNDDNLDRRLTHNEQSTLLDNDGDSRFGFTVAASFDGVTANC